MKCSFNEFSLTVKLEKLKLNFTNQSLMINALLYCSHCNLTKRSTYDGETCTHVHLWLCHCFKSMSVLRMAVILHKATSQQHKNGDKPTEHVWMHPPKVQLISCSQLAKFLHVFAEQTTVTKKNSKVGAANTMNFLAVTFVHYSTLLCKHPADINV